MSEIREKLHRDHRTMKITLEDTLQISVISNLQQWCLLNVDALDHAPSDPFLHTTDVDYTIYCRALHSCST